MDYINKKKTVTGWNYLENIKEPIFLIHDCVLMKAEIKRQLPNDISDLFETNYGWTQNMLYLNNRIHEYNNNRQENQPLVQHPCGPKWVCKQHNANGCGICRERLNHYPSAKWKCVWHCNEVLSSIYRVFDAANGLCMTLMQQIKQ